VPSGELDRLRETIEVLSDTDLVPDLQENLADAIFANVDGLTLCRECAANRSLPRIDLAAGLEGGGSVAFLELVAPVDHPVGRICTARSSKTSPRCTDGLRASGCATHWTSRISPGRTLPPRSSPSKRPGHAPPDDGVRPCQETSPTLIPRGSQGVPAGRVLAMSSGCLRRRNVRRANSRDGHDGRS